MSQIDPRRQDYTPRSRDVLRRAYLSAMDERRYPFTPAVLMYAPAASGVYMLWDGDTLVFVGHACAPDTVLARLMDHYCGRAQPSQATHCGWELRNTQRWLDRVGRIGARERAEPPVYAELD
ncbi:MAG TPA: hypothetical protein VF211_08985 [Burkholderiales bacterium]